MLPRGCRLDRLRGVGPEAFKVMRRAGMHNIEQVWDLAGGAAPGSILTDEQCEEACADVTARIRTAIQAIRDEGTPGTDRGWKRRESVCRDVLLRVLRHSVLVVQVDDTNPELLDCCICKDLFSEPRLVTESGHSYCTICLDGHLKAQTALGVPHTDPCTRIPMQLDAADKYPLNRVLEWVVQSARQQALGAVKGAGPGTCKCN
jgi:hypothetical protein